MEEELVKMAQKGDKEAFYKLVELDSEKLYNIAFCYLKNENDALEAIQETTCRAYVKLKKLREPKFFSTWITRILINYCIDEQKRRKKYMYVEDDNSVGGNASDINIDNIFLYSLLNKLKPEYKSVIILKYLQDMPIEEIAKILECPEGTVKTWIYRALEKLRGILKEEGDINV